MSVWWLIRRGGPHRRHQSQTNFFWKCVLSLLASCSRVKTRPSALGFCKVARPWGRVWRTHWAVSEPRWHLNCGTRTIHLNSRAARLPPALTAPRSLLAPGPSLRRGRPGTEWMTRSPNLAGGTCSAPSCVSSGSWGGCKTYRSLSLCSCRAYRWCERGSAFSGHCCWRSVCRSRQTHIWRASHLLTSMITQSDIDQHKVSNHLSTCFMTPCPPNLKQQLDNENENALTIDMGLE